VTGRREGGWISVFKIPFANFDQSPTAGQTWRINFARERHISDEFTQWNRFCGLLNTVGKFGRLSFHDRSATLTRYEESVDEDPYRVVRRTPRFKEVLTDRPGEYVVGSWGNFEYSHYYYSKEIQARYTPEMWKQEQENYFSEIGPAGMHGPWFPFCLESRFVGKEKMAKYVRQYGMKCPLILYGRYLEAPAIKAGALFTDGESMIVFDPELCKVKDKFLTDFLAENPDVIPNILYVEGHDEPTDWDYVLSPTANPSHRQVLANVDQEIRKGFGFGKYGLYDPFSTTVDPQAAFSRIAYRKWWSDRMARMVREQGALVKRLAPQAGYIGINHNFVYDMDYTDVALVDWYSDYSSTDPYPTCAGSHHGIARGLYHTGFSTKILHDLSGRKVRETLQCYLPNGCATPTPADVREWASQALKNGIQMVEWYTEGPARVTIPDAYREMIRLNHVIHDMNRVRLPETTATAIYFSNVSKWGTNDVAVHPWYVPYAILGEKNGAWFRFVSDTQLDLGRDDLGRYKIVYLPQLKFSDRAAAQKLAAYVKAGGRLVIFDPEAFSFCSDGTRLSDIRQELLGGKILGARSAAYLLSRDTETLGLKPETQLPLTPLHHIDGEGKVLAFDIEPPADARIAATFPDGKPAAYSRKVGKGQILYFAAQPFGNSELAVAPGAWADVFRTLETKVGEKMDLDIWDFELPAKGGEIEIHYVVAPEKRG
jgi:hypothetical protein